MYIVLRQFHASSCVASQVRVMKKLMGGSPKRKSKYFETPTLPTPSTFSKGTHEGKQSINSKRATVLNKLFMHYITDLMATGDCSSEFVGHGIEISRVKITPDFQCVHVFWITKGTEKDKIVEEILQNNTGALRHELAQLKVVGVIPKIRFMKDKQYAQLMEIDRLLAKADFGDDYIPINLSEKLKTDLELNTSLEPNVVKQIHVLETEIQEEVEDSPLPFMPNNVFNLNHTDIIEGIQKSKKKSLALHRQQKPCDDVVEPTMKSVNENPIHYTNVQEERQAFKEFLRKRQIMKTKAEKPDKNYIPDLEYLRAEWLEKQEKFYNNFDVESSEDYDFIEDETDDIK